MIDQLPPDVIADQLVTLQRAKKAIDYLLTGLEAEAVAQIKNGQTIPGWAIDSGMGRAEWKKPMEEVVTLGDLLGKDLRKPLAVITPTQAKDAGVDKALVDAYSKRGTAAAKLVRADATTASRVFGKKS